MSVSTLAHKLAAIKDNIDKFLKSVSTVYTKELLQPRFWGGDIELMAVHNIWDRNIKVTYPNLGIVEFKKEHSNKPPIAIKFEGNHFNVKGFIISGDGSCLFKALLYAREAADSKIRPIPPDIYDNKAVVALKKEIQVFYEDMHTNVGMIDNYGHPATDSILERFKILVFAKNDDIMTDAASHLSEMNAVTRTAVRLNKKWRKAKTNHDTALRGIPLSASAPAIPPASPSAATRVPLVPVPVFAPAPSAPAATSPVALSTPPSTPPSTSAPAPSAPAATSPAHFLHSGPDPTAFFSGLDPTLNSGPDHTSGFHSRLDPIDFLNSNPFDVFNTGPTIQERKLEFENNAIQNYINDLHDPDFRGGSLEIWTTSYLWDMRINVTVDNVVIQYGAETANPSVDIYYDVKTKHYKSHHQTGLFRSLLFARDPTYTNVKLFKTHIADYYKQHIGFIGDYFDSIINAKTKADMDKAVKWASSSSVITQAMNINTDYRADEAVLGMLNGSQAHATSSHNLSQDPSPLVSPPHSPSQSPSHSHSSSPSPPSSHSPLVAPASSHPPAVRSKADRIRARKVRESHEEISRISAEAKLPTSDVIIPGLVRKFVKKRLKNVKNITRNGLRALNAIIHQKIRVPGERKVYLLSLLSEDPSFLNRQEVKKAYSGPLPLDTVMEILKVFSMVLLLHTGRIMRHAGRTTLNYMAISLAFTNSTHMLSKSWQVTWQKALKATRTPQEFKESHRKGSTCVRLLRNDSKRSQVKAPSVLLIMLKGDSITSYYPTVRIRTPDARRRIDNILTYMGSQQITGKTAHGLVVIMEQINQRFLCGHLYKALATAQGYGDIKDADSKYVTTKTRSTHEIGKLIKFGIRANGSDAPAFEIKVSDQYDHILVNKDWDKTTIDGVAITPSSDPATVRVLMSALVKIIIRRLIRTSNDGPLYVTMINNWFGGNI